MVNRILQEKENYIYKLEGECGDMRREIDQLRDKLINVELNHFSNVLDKSLTSNGPMPNSGTISTQCRSGSNFYGGPQRSAMKNKTLNN